MPNTTMRGFKRVRSCATLRGAGLLLTVSLYFVISFGALAVVHAADSITEAEVSTDIEVCFDFAFQSIRIEM